MNDLDDRWRNAFLAVGLVVLLLLGVTPFIAVFRLGAEELKSWWLVFAFQVTITLLGTVVAVAVSIYVVQRLVIEGTRQIIEKLDALRHDHEELVGKVVLRAPPLAVATLLIAEAVLCLADKSFKEDTVATVCVTLALIVLFWIANEFATSESRSRRKIGMGLWILAIVLLPGMIVLHRKGDILLVWREFQSLTLATKIIIALTFVASAAAPYALLEKRDELAT